MELQALLTADYLDIVYDNRNKQYGGYVLRKTCHKRVFSSLSVVLLAAAAFSTYALTREDETVRNVGVICNYPTLDPIPFEVPKPNPKPPVAINASKVDMQQFTTPVVSKDDDVKEPPAELTDKIAGPRNQDGKEGVVSIVGDIDTASAPVGDIKPVVPIKFAEVMPEFNGDLADYLGRKLVYPAAARENGIEGTVIVQFVVSEDGSITNAKVVRGVAGGCNEEARRVVNGMPRWKPGKQNGRPVKVYYTLPIRFVLQ